MTLRHEQRDGGGEVDGQGTPETDRMVLIGVHNDPVVNLQSEFRNCFEDMYGRHSAPRGMGRIGTEIIPKGRGNHIIAGQICTRKPTYHRERLQCAT